MIGSDGGVVHVVRHDAQTWIVHRRTCPSACSTTSATTWSTPFNVCGGMQDNYDWCGPSASRMQRGIMNYDWFKVQGGDGFVAIPDQRDSRIVYTESQDGNIIRRNKVTGEVEEHSSDARRT